MASRPAEHRVIDLSPAFAASWREGELFARVLCTRQRASYLIRVDAGDVLCHCGCKLDLRRALRQQIKALQREVWRLSTEASST